MTNREMAIRFAAKVLEKMLAGETVDEAQEALVALQKEVEVYDLIKEIMEAR